MRFTGHGSSGSQSFQLGAKAPEFAWSEGGSVPVHGTAIHDRTLEAHAQILLFVVLIPGADDAPHAGAQGAPHASLKTDFAVYTLAYGQLVRGFHHPPGTA